LIFINGTRGQKLDELSQTVSERYKTQWDHRPKVDSTELAKKRFIESWSIPRLAEHFGLSTVSVQKRLAKMRKSGDISKLDLNKLEQGLVKKRLGEFFKGV